MVEEEESAIRSLQGGKMGRGVNVERGGDMNEGARKMYV